MTTDEDNVNTKLFEQVQRLRELRIEHRDLDDVIGRLTMDLYIDELQLRRLKKRKLLLEGPDRAARKRTHPRPERMNLAYTRQADRRRARVR